MLHENEEPCQRIAALTGDCEDILQENDIYLTCIKLLHFAVPIVEGKSNPRDQGMLRMK